MEDPGPIDAAPSNPPTRESSRRMLPWLVAVAFFMESLDTTISTRRPTMAAALHVVPLSMKSVLTSYTLSLAVFIPVSGWVADRFGTRVVFASAMASSPSGLPVRPLERHPRARRLPDPPRAAAAR